MADNTSQGPRVPEPTGIPLRLVRGDASPEEVAALVAILAAAGGDPDPDPTGRHTLGSGRRPHARWNSLRRMVREAHPHGPGGWRASAAPR